MLETENASSLAKNVRTHALKDHPQIPAMIDILSRTKQHHLFLSNSYSEKINQALVDAIILKLEVDQKPKTLSAGEFLYVDARFATDFSALIKNIYAANKIIILAINECSPALICELASILHCRLIVFADNLPKELRGMFCALKLIPPRYVDLVGILKSFRAELEASHHVIIPDETLAAALSMASHYFNIDSRLDEAFNLLDSTAARLSGCDQQESHKPIVTITQLTTTVSYRTQIPLSHLQNNKYQAMQVTHALQKRIFGQDGAISLISSLLQHACIKLEKKNGPLCSFLLVGPQDVGKVETAYAVAEHLFGSSDALLHVNLCKSHYATFSDIKIIANAYSHHTVSLLEAVKMTPYAVILIENINQAPAGTLDLLKEIFIQGYTVDDKGIVYDFRNAIIFMTTTVGAEKISHLMQAPHTHESPKTLDLMQLVLNENLHDHSANASAAHTSEDLCHEITPILDAYFSPILLQSLHVVPYIPLDYAALEKIMRLKIKTLAAQLDTKFGIELNYAPEVIKFIAHETLWRKPTQSLEKILQHSLYSCVAHEILANNDSKNRSKRLFIQLNDNGQLLKCEFMSGNETGIYTI